ncbi:MAG: hypothetical protein KTR16_10880 [Acidiferrobacterales bacterium]|nr:hypothetical protein [Acidiferrobacterales bacterium]
MQCVTVYYAATTLNITLRKIDGINDERVILPLTNRMTDTPWDSIVWVLVHV